MTRSSTFALLLTLTVLSACGSSGDQSLPILGRTTYTEVNGQLDTVYHTIPDFSFVDQDSMEVTQDTFKDKIYVADFFFWYLSNDLPGDEQQMLRVYAQFKDNPQFAILSHTIDPAHDTVAYLKNYSMNIGVPDNQTWHFVTGNKDEIYAIGSEEGYMVPVGEDGDAPGGFIHSGAFLLVDKERRIRGIYDGTKSFDVDELMADIPKLLAEYE